MASITHPKVTHISMGQNNRCFMYKCSLSRVVLLLLHETYGPLKWHLEDMNALKYRLWKVYGKYFRLLFLKVRGTGKVLPSSQWSLPSCTIQFSVRKETQQVGGWTRSIDPSLPVFKGRGYATYFVLMHCTLPVCIYLYCWLPAVLSLSIPT